MKLEKPPVNALNEVEIDVIWEKRYLTHCANIARILADKNGWGSVGDRLRMYVQITGAELADDKSKG